MARQRVSSAKNTIQIEFNVINNEALSSIREVTAEVKRSADRTKAELEKNRNSWQQWAQGVNASWQLGKDFFGTFRDVVSNGLDEINRSAGRLPGAFDDVRESFQQLDGYRDLFSVWAADIVSGLIPELGDLSTSIDELGIRRAQQEYEDAREHVDGFTRAIEVQTEWVNRLHTEVRLWESQVGFSATTIREQLLPELWAHQDLLTTAEQGVVNWGQAVERTGFALARMRGDLEPVNESLRDMVGFLFADDRGEGGGRSASIRRIATDIESADLWMARLEFSTSGMVNQGQELVQLFQDLGNQVVANIEKEKLALEGTKGFGLLYGISEEAPAMYGELKDKLRQALEVAEESTSPIGEAFSGQLAGMLKSLGQFTIAFRGQFRAIGDAMLQELGGVFAFAGETLLSNVLTTVIAGGPFGWLETIGGVLLSAGAGLIGGIGGGGGVGRVPATRIVFNPATQLFPQGSFGQGQGTTVVNNFNLGTYFARDESPRALAELQNDMRRRGE